MKANILLILGICVAIAGCAGVNGSTSSDIPEADLSVTVDCPNNQASVYLSGESVKGIEKTKAVQISRIQTEMLNSKYLNVKIAVHPIDANNNFVDDLPTNSTFCEVIDSSNYKRSAIKDYTVTKVSKADKVPTYFAFILDHSGSMGEERVRNMQKAIADFARNEISDEDRILVVKFDVNNKSMIFPTKSSPEFEPFITNFVNGLGEYGSATALYDAVETGLEELQFSTGDEYAKSLIILTDGYENSSKVISSADELVQLANSSRVAVHSIAYSDNVDKLLLADTLAMQTGGIYQSICSQQEMKLVFSDIYYRTKNYYLVEYNTINYPGIHTVKVKVCDKSLKKSLYAKNLYLVPSKDKELPIPIDVYFDFAKFTLKQNESRKAIDIMDTLLRNDPAMKIEIQGHTDSIGTDKANQTLSENRAKAVVNALIAKGINKERISAVGFGATKPIADNSTEEGRAANRRVVFVIKSSSSTAKRTIPYYSSPHESSISN